MKASVGGTAINPQTQEILNKYGITFQQPNIPISSSNGRDIIINNNKEEEVVNNVQVVSPATVNKVPTENSGISKLKYWITSSFKKRKEQDEIRSKQLDRESWSLSRSANRMMGKLEDIGKSTIEAFSPKRVAGLFNDQFKTLLFLFGISFLADNWVELLEKFANILKWIKKQANYFGIELGENGQLISLKKGRSGFVKDLILFLGGDPEGEKGPLGCFGDLLKSALNLLFDKLKIIWKERAESIKAVEFPKLNEGDDKLSQFLYGLSSYLTDLLACFVGGTAGLSQNIRKAAEAEGRSQSMSSEGADEQKNEGLIDNDEDKEILDDTGAGDAVIVGVGGKQKESRMNSYDFKGEDLRDNMASSIKQSLNISQMIKNRTSSTINTAGVMSGLARLERSAQEHGKTLVDEDFIKTLANYLNIHHIPANRHDYKFTSVLNDGERKTGTDKTYVLKLVDGDDKTKSGVSLEVPIFDREDKYGYVKNKKVNKKFFSFWELTPKSFEIIRKGLEYKAGLGDKEFKIDAGDEASMKGLYSVLETVKRNNIEKAKGRLYTAEYANEKLLPNLKSDYDLSKFDVAREIQEQIRRMQEESDEKYNNSPLAKSLSYVENRSKDFIENFTKSAYTDEVKGAVELLKENEGFREHKYKLEHEKTYTIGYGFTEHGCPWAKKYFDADYISKEKAEEELEKEVIRRKNSVKKQLGTAVWDKLTTGQKIALIDFAYNNGSLDKDLRNAIKGGTVEEIESNLRNNGDRQKQATYESSWAERWAKRVALWNMESQPSTETTTETLATTGTTSTNSKSSKLNKVPVGESSITIPLKAPEGVNITTFNFKAAIPSYKDWQSSSKNKASNITKSKKRSSNKLTASVRTTATTIKKSKKKSTNNRSDMVSIVDLMEKNTEQIREITYSVSNMALAASSDVGRTKITHKNNKTVSTSYTT